MKHAIRELDFAGKVLRFETGFMAPRANASVLVSYGDTMVLATATASPLRDEVDFFPLRVDYEEKLYAGGVIKGSRFIKREGRPSDKATLGSRLIDRTIRPFFPKDYYDRVQVIATVLSVDGENDPQLLALLGATAALEISDIPWNGPLAAVQVGLNESGFVLNPVIGEESQSLGLLVSSSKERVVMIEATAKEIPESQMVEAIDFAQQQAQPILQLIEDLKIEVGLEKYSYEARGVDPEALEAVSGFISKRLKEHVLDDPDDKLRYAELEKDVLDQFGDAHDPKILIHALSALQKTILREVVIKDKKRVDGRAVDEVRPIVASLGLLPRTHGSALFNRGKTQALTTTTLGASSLEQLIEGMEGEETKGFMHHYNAPPYSVGEVRPIFGPSRRDIGHGALAEKALLPVLPDKDDFPYTIRLVSEVLSQNGSSSMASTCGSSLSLMDAGVPIKSHVAGISMGLVEGEQGYTLLTDIRGVEDFSGDMDFKITGTREGITAIQLDVKNTGLTRQMVCETAERSREARLKILDIMDEVIRTPRSEISKYAPRILTIKIDPEKIGEVIGSGGRVIKGLIKDTGADIEVKDDGTVVVSSQSEESTKRAVELIEAILKEPEPGEIYKGKVVRILDFGAFVEILPNKDGLVHISELSHSRVNKVEDVVKVGDEVEVKVIGVDNMGRVNLSMKALKEAPPSSHNSGGDNRGGQPGGRDRRQRPFRQR